MLNSHSREHYRISPQLIKRLSLALRRLTKPQPSSRASNKPPASSVHLLPTKQRRKDRLNNRLQASLAHLPLIKPQHKGQRNSRPLHSSVPLLLTKQHLQPKLHGIKQHSSVHLPLTKLLPKLLHNGKPLHSSVPVPPTRHYYQLKLHRIKQHSLVHLRPIKLLLKLLHNGKPLVNLERLLQIRQRHRHLHNSRRHLSLVLQPKTKRHLQARRLRIKRHNFRLRQGMRHSNKQRHKEHRLVNLVHSPKM